MLERARALLKFKSNRLKRKALEITLPEVCDKGMQRDGIEPKPYFQGIGEKAWWLQQLLGRIPPTVWRQESGWEVSELIEAAKRSDWKNVLLEGWSQAACLYQDVEWADALLAETFGKEQAVSTFQILPQERQEAFITGLLRNDPSLHTSKPSRNYLAACAGRWSEAFSRVVVDSLLYHAVNDGFKVVWWWSDIIPTIGCRLAPALIHEAVTRLTEATKAWSERAPALERFLDFIQIRHEMLEEITQ